MRFIIEAIEKSMFTKVRAVSPSRGLPRFFDYLNAVLNSPPAPKFPSTILCSISAVPIVMASVRLPSLLRTTTRSLRRSTLPAFSPAFARSVSTKHPAGFTPPTEEELLELRERVQEFTSGFFLLVFWDLMLITACTGREIPADVAARTDEQNEFPSEMWKKLGDAG